MNDLVSPLFDSSLMKMIGTHFFSLSLYNLCLLKKLEISLLVLVLGPGYLVL